MLVLVGRTARFLFICDFDIFQKGSSIYTFENVCKEYPELTLPDKRKTIFLNIHGNRDGVSEELSTVLDYFETSNPTDEYTRGLEERVEENSVKNEFFTRQICACGPKFAGCEKGRENYMTWEMKLDERYRQGMEKGLATGRVEGLATGRAEMIQKLLKNGMTPEEVAALTELSVEEVEKMKNTDKASV